MSLASSAQDSQALQSSAVQARKDLLARFMQYEELARKIASLPPHDRWHQLTNAKAVATSYPSASHTFPTKNTYVSNISALLISTDVSFTEPAFLQPAQIQEPSSSSNAKDASRYTRTIASPRHTRDAIDGIHWKCSKCTQFGWCQFVASEFEWNSIRDR